MQPLVTIIMPTYNAEPFIAEAIASVLSQDYSNWELLIVNDASTDGTAGVIEQFSDPRIRVFHEPLNGGIGHARNVAMDQMRGTYLCTFDSDDVLPPKSISSRVAMMEREPDVDIADGIVVVHDRDMKNVLRTFRPTFVGEPLNDLLAIGGQCFFGPSWMLRWSETNTLRFETRLSHAEDLLFYISLSKGRRYKAVAEEVLHYRVTGTSAMSRLDGLERSYHFIENWLRDNPQIASKEEVDRFRRKWKQIMIRTWLKKLKPMNAMKTVIR